LLDGSNIPGNIAFLIREIPLKKAPDGLIRYHSGIVTSLIWSRPEKLDKKGVKD